MDSLWPVFILAPAAGFLAMYLGGEKDKGLLVPAGILSGVAVLFLLARSGFGDLWPVFLIIAGIIMILSQLRKQNKAETEI